MPFKLSDQAETNFNAYRAHFTQLLVEGALYQFEDFFFGIRATLGSLFPGMGRCWSFRRKPGSLRGECHHLGSAERPDWFIWGYVMLGGLKKQL